MRGVFARDPTVTSQAYLEGDAIVRSHWKTDTQKGSHPCGLNGMNVNFGTRPWQATHVLS
jgi:hypothetical protein